MTSRSVTAPRLMALSVLVAIAVASQASAQNWHRQTIDILDSRSAVRWAIGRGMVLELTREQWPDGRVLGWHAAVYRGRSQRNLLFPPGHWHGPQEWDVLAGHYGDHVYPNDLALPVYGTNAEIRIRVLSPELERSTEDGPPIAFSGGQIEVLWCWKGGALGSHP